MEFITSPKIRLQLEELLANKCLKKLLENLSICRTTRAVDIECELKDILSIMMAPGCQIDALLLQNAGLIPYFFLSTPSFLVKTVAPFMIYNVIKEELVHLLRQLFRAQNRSVLSFVLNVCLSLRYAAASHLVEEEELMHEAMKYESIIKAIFQLQVFDDTNRLDLILLPSKKNALLKIYQREWFDCKNKFRDQYPVPYIHFTLPPTREVYHL